MNSGKWIFITFICSLTISFFYFSGKFILDIVTPFIISLILYYIAKPIVTFFEERELKIWGIATFFLILFLGLFALLWILVPNIISSFRELAALVPGYINNISKYIEASVVYEIFPNIGSLLDMFAGSFSYFARGTFSSVYSLIDGVIKFLFALVLTFYFLKDSNDIKEFTTGLIPNKIKSETLSFFREIDAVLSGFIRSQLLMAAYLSTIGTIIFWIAGIKFPLLLGIFTGIMDIIPFFGAPIALLPILLTIFITSPIKALWVGAAFFVAHQIEDRILLPKITQKCIGLHPIITLLAVLIGARLSGFIGAIIFIPLFGIFRVIFRRVIAAIV